MNDAYFTLEGDLFPSLDEATTYRAAARGPLFTDNRVFNSYKRVILLEVTTDHDYRYWFLPDLLDEPSMYLRDHLELGNEYLLALATYERDLNDG